MKRIISAFALILLATPLFAAGVVYEGKSGPGSGKHIVLVSGDEEYRSEEALPQLGKILGDQGSDASHGPSSFSSRR